MKRNVFTLYLILVFVMGCYLLPPESKLKNPFDGPLPFFATLLDDLSRQLSASNTANTIEVSGVIDTVAEGQAFTVGIKLSKAPAGTVSVSISSNSSALTLNGATTYTISFNGSNYSSEQYITVATRIDSNNVNESVTLSFKAEGFSEVTRVVTVSDDLIPVITGTPSSIEEGKTATIQVKLSKAITLSRELSINSNNAAIAVNDSSRVVLTFDETNWDKEQNVVLTAVTDSNTDSETANLSFVLDGSGIVNYSVTNQEQASGTVVNTFSLSNVPTEVHEGMDTERTIYIRLSLKSPTTQSVSIISDRNTVTIIPSTLIFTPENSTVEQSFQISILGKPDDNTNDDTINIILKADALETYTLPIKEIDKLPAECYSAEAWSEAGCFWDNNNGTVLFKGAGAFLGTTLVWMKCTQGQVWNSSNNDCTGIGSSADNYGADNNRLQYCTSNDNSCDDGTSLTSGSVFSSCDSLSFTGKTDWRVPSINELSSLIYCNDRIIPTSGQCNNFSSPTINYLFPNSVSSFYWSTNSDRTCCAWVVQFSTGFASTGGVKYYQELVRCVRTGP
ncbi:MAG: DUF1566 domain-containing protein [Leptospiraceae bacterium]|nr:DUF1566 domain-containing protein [Leptospiraceae bacterium]